jgi:hypothetical protein
MAFWSNAIMERGHIVDSKQFDALVARLAKGPSRRDALKGIVGGTLAAVGVTSVIDADADAKKKGRRGAGAENRKKGRGRAGAEACIQTGKKCPAKKPRGKKKKKLSCDKCCQGTTTTGANGKTKCACKPSGPGTASSCTAQTAYQCCSGICGTNLGVANRCRDY